ncbi:MAG: type II toxin-antitoxin system Phd/YefM family antitoxin [Chloroflexi bacterium]|nr:type II toxin-antitoxin system Phd/YefM family antitoxin [Chloroflexota bacterium]
MLDLLQNPFVGVHELRKELPQLLKRVHEEGADVVVTQQGKPVAILLSVERYLEMREAIRDFSDPQYAQELIAARREIDEGKGITAEEVYREAGLS